MNKVKKLLPVLVFVLVEIVLFVLIFTISGPAHKWISFVSILLCFLFSLGLISFSKSKILTQIGLFTTVIADVFLVLLSNYHVVAMLFFSITQIAYFLRLLFDSSSKKEKLIHIIIRLVVVVAVVVTTILVLKEKLDALSLISMFYYANLVLNVIFAFVQIKKSVLFAIGLLCFAICDAFIGLQAAIGTYISVPENSFISQVVFSPFNWAWFFYVPAQVLIVLSIVFKEKKSSNSEQTTKT